MRAMMRMLPNRPMGDPMIFLGRLVRFLRGSNVGHIHSLHCDLRETPVSHRATNRPDSAVLQDPHDRMSNLIPATLGQSFCSAVGVGREEARNTQPRTKGKYIARWPSAGLAP